MRSRQNEWPNTRQSHKENLLITIPSSLITQIASEATLQRAYEWLCQRRKDSHFNNDVWHLRYHWSSILPQLRQTLLTGTYQFSPCRSLKIGAESVGVWCAQDAVVLKAMTWVLTEHLAPSLSQDCYHLKGHGGSKGCVNAVKVATSQYRYVCRSDVNSYYATIDHGILLKQLKRRIHDPRVIDLCTRMLDRLDDVDAVLHTATVGITKGNPISPLLGALYLSAMDEGIGGYCRKRGLRYFRYMDDWLILCRTRHQLRHVVKLMNQHLDAVKQTKHPYKTYIGRIKESGFDFLGYRITPHNPLKLAWKTIANHLGKLQRLYEQGASESRIAAYVKRWVQWARSGVAVCLEEIERQVLGKRGVAGTGNSLGDCCFR